MSAQLIRMRDAGIDTLVLYSVDREAGAILRSMDRVGYRPTIVSAWGNSAQLGKQAGALADGMLIAGTFSWTGELSPRAQKVWDRMKQKFNLKDPSELVLPSVTANAYDAIYLVAEAVKVAGEFNRKKVRDAFYRVKYDGIITRYDPAFDKAQQRHDAIVPGALQAVGVPQGPDDADRAELPTPQSDGGPRPRKGARPGAAAPGREGNHGSDPAQWPDRRPPRGAAGRHRHRAGPHRRDRAAPRRRGP